MSDNAVDTSTSTDAAPEVNSEQKTFSLEYVQTLRNEAARHRTAKQALEEALKEQHEQAITALQADADVKLAEAQTVIGAKEIEVAKLKAALDLQVPKDKVESFVDSIKGSTVDEVNASAQALSDLAGGFAAKNSPAFDPTQGQGSHLPLNGDPLLRALKEKLGK